MSEVTAVNSLSETQTNSQTGDVDDETLDSQDDKEVLKSVDELLDLVTVKFHKMAGEMNSKLDEMAQRLDELEASIKANSHAAESEPDPSTLLLDPLKPLEELEPLEPLEVEFAKRERERQRARSRELKS